MWVNAKQRLDGSQHRPDSRFQLLGCRLREASCLLAGINRLPADAATSEAAGTRMGVVLPHVAVLRFYSAAADKAN